MAAMSLTESEIRSQPDVWDRALARVDAVRQVLGPRGERVLVTGCGTSAFMAASLAALREAAGLGETDWAYASEAPAGRRYDRVVALTRSGTTTEVLDVLSTTARAHPGTRRGVVTAVVGSPVEDYADDVVRLDLADEASVVQTRFPTTLVLLARAACGEDVAGLPAACAAALDRPLPFDVADVDHHVYLGRGWTTGLAHEAALKIREAAQAWSESYPALDYRHGPLAVAGPRSAVWFLDRPPSGLVDDVEATGARVVVLADDPLVRLVTAQRVAVALAEHRGLDPDHPRHLTRSVVLARNGATP
ncbi:MAG: SIS domain-containing protein [Kineosporiaceae bacterium]